MVNKEVSNIIEDIHMELDNTIICVTDVYNNLLKLKRVLPKHYTKGHSLLDIIIQDMKVNTFNYNKFLIAFDELEYSIIIR